MTGNLYELRGRTEGAVADVRPASALDLAGVAIIDNFLRALTADDNDHTIE
ncbi:hypothetical protein [Rhodococcus koreensis]|uniref:hypothetical protein n=1 Tax=Rhodococcus koreensis TaxID=99653 RepID=UPI0036DB560A